MKPSNVRVSSADAGAQPRSRFPRFVEESRWLTAGSPGGLIPGRDCLASSSDRDAHRPSSRWEMRVEFWGIAHVFLQNIFGTAAFIFGWGAVAELSFKRFAPVGSKGSVVLPAAGRRCRFIA